MNNKINSTRWISPFMRMGNLNRFLPIAIAGLLVCSAAMVRAQSVAVTGELKRWHKVTLTLDGPTTSEGGTPNPFLDYRMNVTFSNTTSGLTYKVPGYFAADGNAAETSATSGNQWRAHLSPDDTGTWTYSISFRSGTEVAVNASATAGTALAPFDGVSGSFAIVETDKTGRDHRGRGRLEYVNKHHLRFAGDGTYFMKAGADSPENFLAYDDFDNTPDTSGRRKSWSPHVQDWNAGDPVWKGTLGKGIIGAINYLSEKGCNAQSFLTYSFNGDDKNVFPYAVATDRLRMDCSKLDQWEIVFAQGDKMGVYLHFKTQETENDQNMDGGALGNERKLYYRELIARYGHHLALNWNLGEENTNTEAQRKAFAQFFYDNDPYRHNVVLHTYPGDKTTVYTPLLGTASKLTGVSLQSGVSSVYGDTKTWVNNSAAAGKPWVVANDEQGGADTGINCDSAVSPHNDTRKNVLWGNFMAGGAGVEAYYGYQTCESDLTAQDHRTRDVWYSQCAHALRFFHDFGVPFWDMSNQDNLVSGVTGGRCLRKAGESYVIQLPNGGSPSLNLSGAAGNYEVKWFDPRNGGNLQNGSVLNVAGGGTVSLGSAPSQTTLDWIVLARLVGGVSANAGPDQTKTFPQNTNQISVSLNGSVSAGGNPFTATWTQISGPGSVTFANLNAPVTTAVITGSPGAYVLQLAATSDTNSASDTLTVTVNAWTPDTTPPVVTITAPANGAVLVEGMGMNVTATITDNAVVQSGELFVDGTSQGVDNATPFEWTVNGLALGAHTLAVRGLDDSGNAATNSISISVISAPSRFYVNCGGAAYTAADGNTFVADGIFNSGGSTYSTTSLISGTLDAPLYQSERYGSAFSYNLPLTNGSYEVTLMFAEIYFNAAGSRVFNVAMEGTPVITNLDIWTKVGKNVAYNETNVVTVSDGQLNLAFSSVFDNAKISAIRVERIDGVRVNAGPDQTKTFPQTTNQVSVSLSGSVSAGGNPFTATWSQLSGPGTVTFANANAPVTTATLTGAPGAYVLQLAAVSDTNSASDTLTVTVNAWTPDTTPPVVSITAPANGATVQAGTPVNVTATITDNQAVQSGELFVDGNSRGVDAAAPYAWTVSGLSLGAHSLAVRGLDATGNAATNSISITVSSAVANVLTITNVAAQDAYIQNTGGTIAVLDTVPLRVENNTPTRTRDGYLRFAITNIPPGATINSITLRVNNQRPTTANGTYVVYAGSAAPWVDASPGPNTLANGLITAGAQIGQFVNPAPNSILNIPLTNSFITTNGSYNLVLKKTTVSVEDIEISTSENATAGLRPALIIDMDVTPPDLLPPVVNFVSPTNGANYPSELPFIVELDVTDDGVVTEVTLDVDGDVVDLLSTPPWTFTYSPLPIGARSITVVAEDATGKRATNAITVQVTPPVAPTINILAPANGQLFFEGMPVTFTADVTDDVAVTNVTLYADMEPVATFTAPPYSVVLTNLSVGQHSLAVVARDNGGRIASNGANITVQFGYLDTTPPAVAITSPTNSASFLAGRGVPVSATVTDNGLLTQVILLVDGSPVVTNTAPPFNWNVTGLAVGPHTLRVVGVDSQNNSAFAEVAIEVTPDTVPPTVLITAPANGASFRMGTVVNVSATLSDNAAVQSGELFVDGISLGLDFAAPYTWELNNLSAGLRVLAVRGVDASGNAATDSVSVLIDNTPPPANAILHMTPVGPDSFFLSWGPSNWVLDATTNLAAGGWFEVLGATSPFLVSTIEEPNMFFRTRLVLPDPPLAPVAIAANAVTNTSFVARWNSASGATGYWLDVATDNLFTSYVSGYANLDVGNALTRTVAGLTASTTYYYRVRAYNTGGTSGNSGTITVTTLTPPPPVGNPLVLWATTNFPNINAGAVPSYKDNARNALAIDAANVSYRGQFAAAETTFAGTAGTYNLTLTTLTETDGECTYRVLVGGVLRGTFTNPRSGTDYLEVNQTFSNLTVAAGATIRVEFNTHSNGLIPEGSGFAWARGRWRKLVLTPNINAPSGAWVESGGMVVMEAEKTSSAYGLWAKVNPGDALYVAGATGTGHIQFNGNTPSGGNANSPLVYQFKINQTGTYRMYLRARKNLEGAATDLCNDAYVKLAGNYTAGAGGGYLSLLQNNTKFFGGNPTSWAWAAQLDDTSVNPDVKYSALYNFTAGEVYTFTMSGRSQRFNVDRIVFRLNGVADATWQNAPESPRAP